MNNEDELDRLLIQALKSEPKQPSLPYGFAHMLTRKVFASRLQPLGLKSYSALVLVVAIALSFALLILQQLVPSVSGFFLSMLYKAKYAIAFVVFICLATDYLDRRLVSKV